MEDRVRLEGPGCMVWLLPIFLVPAAYALFVYAQTLVSWQAMRATAATAAGGLLRELRLFDRYAGKGVEPGFKSLAMGLILQEESRTLTDQDVDALVDAVVAALGREHRAEIRR